MTILTKIEARQPVPAVGKQCDQPPITTSAIPPLANGDRLTRAEFERRYKAHPEIKKPN